MKSALIIAAVFVLGACTTHHQTRVDYSAYNIYASGQAGNKAFKDVGPVTGSKTAWPWTGCDVVTIDAIKNMLDEAKAFGANTVYDVKFIKDGVPTPIPTCSRFWLPVPLFGSATVTGIAAKLEKPEDRTSSISIPADADTTVIATEWFQKMSKMTN